MWSEKVNCDYFDMCCDLESQGLRHSFHIKVELMWHVFIYQTSILMSGGQELQARASVPRCHTVLSHILFNNWFEYCDFDGNIWILVSSYASQMPYVKWCQCHNRSDTNTFRSFSSLYSFGIPGSCTCCQSSHAILINQSNLHMLMAHR